MNSKSPPLGWSCLALASLFFSALSIDSAAAQVIAEQARQSTTLEEVVVTARKREEGLQETPVAVSAFAGEAMLQRQTLRTSDLSKYVPNLQFDAVAAESGGAGATQVAIRGIGQTDYVLTVEPGVGIYLDGVYVSKSVGSLMSTWDLERVEVLRGPQGTLFGRNTIAGAVLLKSKRPTDEPFFTADVAGGEGDRFDIMTALSGPVGDSLRFRISGGYQSRDGHVDRVLPDGTPTGETQGNVDSLFGRVVAELDMSESMRATVALDASGIDEESPGQVLVKADENAPFAALNNSIVFPECDPLLNDPQRFVNTNCFNTQWIRDVDSLESTNSGPNRSDVNVWGASLTLDWNVGVLDAKSITAYRSVDADISQELTASPTYFNFIGQDIKLDQFSQEIQVSGRSLEDRLEYLVGLYYLNEDGDQAFPVDLALIQFTSGGKIENESWAVFGEVSYDLTDQLTIAAGLRYTDEKRRFNPQQFLRSGILVDAFGGPGTPIFLSGWYERTDSSLDPSVTLEYAFIPEIRGYFRYAEGFKGGGFVMRYFPPVVPAPGTDPDSLIGYAEPETATLYEIGLKTELLQRRLRINSALFWTNYEDLQITFNVDPDGPGPIGAFVPVLANAGEAEIKGIEIETEFLPTHWLRLDGSVGYLDAKYTSFSELAQSQLPSLPDELPNAPKWTFHAGVTADLFENANGNLFIRADYSYTDDQFKEFTNEISLRQGSYHLLDASLNYRTPNTRWLVSLGVTNLTDEIYIVSGVNNDGIGYAQAVVSRPREWFLRFNFQL
jgi:iron complex outermembrane receptor protein